MAITWLNKHSISGFMLTVTLFEIDSELLPEDVIDNPMHRAYGIPNATGLYYSQSMNKSCTQDQFKALLKEKIDNHRSRIVAETASKSLFDFSTFEALIGAK